VVEEPVSVAVAVAAVAAAVEVVVAALAPRSSNTPNHRRSTRLQRRRLPLRRLQGGVYRLCLGALPQLLRQHPSLRKLQRQQEPPGFSSSPYSRIGKTPMQLMLAVYSFSSLPPSNDEQKFWPK
jgi:hypothetical protein